MDPEHCLFAGVSDKLATAKHILARLDMELCEMAYMGDDLPDLELLQAVGLSAAPGDAVPEVRCEVQVVTNKLAGRGAVREFTELLLNQQLSSRQS
jgi:3-deoxy-D-manno-octulosonate 8-phosphate phosphatase (KDO 8-P phosphatase)